MRFDTGSARPETLPPGTLVGSAAEEPETIRVHPDTDHVVEFLRNLADRIDTRRYLINEWSVSENGAGDFQAYVISVSGQHVWYAHQEPDERG